MTLKKGDRVQTEDGDVGEILFVDKGGVEAQVALARISLKVRTETLVKLSPEDRPVQVAAAPKAASPAPKRVRARRSAKS
jgi:hypothetical protein